MLRDGSSHRHRSRTPDRSHLHRGSYPQVPTAPPAVPCEDECMDRDQFITLDELARELTMSLDNVRYRFKQLRRSNQLVDGVDYVRDDYVNETNFVYRVDPSRFYLEAGFPSLAGGRPLASTPLPTASAPTSNSPSETEWTASGSLASIDILRERLSFKEEQIEWKQEQLEETREELSTLREERKMFTRALTQAFETIQGLNAQLMTLAAPTDRGATASSASSRGSTSASDEAEEYLEAASDAIHFSSDPARDGEENFLATP